ncbi:hypothetical protein ACWELQ_37090, partial [Nocardia sp. NPDC004722]
MTAVLNRLTPDDDLFLKLHDLYGTALVNQLAWRFDEPLEPAVLQRFHDQLAHGFLARRVRTTAVPFARPWWVAADAAEPLAYQVEPVAENGVLDWLFDQSRVEFDLHQRAVGLGGQLGAVHLGGRGVPRARRGVAAR